MKHFARYLQETTIDATGYRGPRYSNQYIKPFIGQKSTHRLDRNVGNMQKGEHVSILSTREENGKHFATIKHEGTGETHEVPHNFLHKPPHVVHHKTKDAFQQEAALADRLKQHGLMDPTVAQAGNSGGHDFHIINKKSNKIFYGKEIPNIKEEPTPGRIAGEFKKKLQTSQMGTIGLRYSHERGWHVPLNNENRHPRFSEALRRATVNGKPIFEHMNEHWGPPPSGVHHEWSPPGITADTSDLHPAHAYLRDHGVDILHIGTHGTFRAGHSESRDRTGIGLPAPTGTGRMTVSKDRGAYIARFKPFATGFSKSHIDLGKDEDLEKIKKRLGHT